MRATVLSDSHSDTNACDRAIAATNPDVIIHLGDIARDCEYLEAVYAPVPVISVVGNNDFFAAGERELCTELDGHRIFLCHGHTLGVHRSIDALLAAAKAHGCTAALYGHTHIAKMQTEDGVLLLNPGSCSRPRGGQRPSFAVLETGGGKLNAVITDWIL